MRNDSAKVRLRKSRSSITGLCPLPDLPQLPQDQRRNAAMQMMVKVVMKCEPNQSSSCPLSSTTSRQPKPSAVNTKPM